MSSAGSEALVVRRLPVAASISCVHAWPTDTCVTFPCSRQGHVEGSVSGLVLSPVSVGTLGGIKPFCPRKRERERERESRAALPNALLNWEGLGAQKERKRERERDVRRYCLPQKEQIISQSTAIPCNNHLCQELAPPGSRGTNVAEPVYGCAPRGHLSLGHLCL